MSAAKTAAVAVSSNQAPPANLKDLAAQGRAADAADRRAREAATARSSTAATREAAGESATLWEIPESAHVGGLKARPEEYERRVIGFFDERCCR